MERQSDASYFFVVGRGWYYSMEVLGDFSRFVLASDLNPDMTAGSISGVVEQAVAFTGMRQVPVEDRTKLLSDNGSGYWARVFEGLRACSKSGISIARRIIHPKESHTFVLCSQERPEQKWTVFTKDAEETLLK